MSEWSCGGRGRGGGGLDCANMYNVRLHAHQTLSAWLYRFAERQRSLKQQFTHFRTLWNPLRLCKSPESACRYVSARAGAHARQLQGYVCPFICSTSFSTFSELDKSLHSRSQTTQNNNANRYYNCGRDLQRAVTRPHDTKLSPFQPHAPIHNGGTKCRLLTQTSRRLYRQFWPRESKRQ